MQEHKTDYSLAGWAALIGGLLIGWFGWQWLEPRYPIALAAMWTFLAICLGACLIYAAMRPFVTGLVEGWRRALR